MDIILIIVVVLLLCGGGWGLRSGAIGLGEPLFLILFVIIIIALLGGIAGPHLGWYHW